MITSVTKPKKKSKLNLMFEKRNCIKARDSLVTGTNVRLAKKQENVFCTNDCFNYSTPLIRTLKNVDIKLQYNKIKNLKIATSQLNKIVLYPGETFSFWHILGKPSKVKGYKKGIVLENGTLQTETGGGLGQLSNLIYWMTLHTPLTVKQRYRHKFDVFPDSGRTQPFGSGATCIYDYKDLIIQNDTNQVFQLLLTVTKEELVGAWLSDKPLEFTYKVYEKEHKINKEKWGGFSRHNLIYRKVFDKKGKQISDEYITENHAAMMYDPIAELKNSI